MEKRWPERYSLPVPGDFQERHRRGRTLLIPDTILPHEISEFLEFGPRGTAKKTK